METIDVKAVVVEQITPTVSQRTSPVIWNHEELKAFLEERTEIYKNLIVTDANLEDMKKVLREIVKLRTSITKFGQEQKRELKAPMDKFAFELNDVLTVVHNVEYPISAQITEFENEEMRKRKESVMKEIALKASALGVKQEYMERLDVDKRWWENKTIKFADVTMAIDAQLSKIKEQQQADEDFARIKADKEDMLRFELEQLNANYDLSTPIKERDVYQFFSLPIGEARDNMKAVFEKRLDIELTATKQAEIAKNVPVADEPIKVETKEITADYTLCLANITKEQLERIERGFKTMNISYTVTMKDEVMF